MSEYRDDKEWSDRLIDQVKEKVGRIVGPKIFTVATVEADQRENSDLMLVAKDIRVAVRLRRPGYFSKYGGEITFRLGRASGAETEFSKVLRGFGDFFFYGHVEECSVAHYVVIDLAAFRREWEMPERVLKFTDKANRDGQTFFRAFRMESFPKGVIFRGTPSIARLIGRL